jgi:hypothetical protein
LVRLVVLLSVATLAACHGSSTAPPFDTHGPNTFVGQLVADPDTFIGIAWADTRFRVHLCNGTDQAAATVVEWFATDHVNPESELLMSAHGARLSLSRGAVQVSGTFTSSVGNPFAFTASIGTGSAAFIWPSDPGAQSGWVRLMDGEVRNGGLTIPSNCACNAASNAVFCRTDAGDWELSPGLTC